MNRSQRAELAQQTLTILERGAYTTPAGRELSIRAELDAVRQSSVVYGPEELADLGAPARERHATLLEVTAETTLAAAARLVSAADDPVLVLNFASAKHPGGGFLSGSEAQEESLARSSALYTAELAAPRFYQTNRATRSCLYTDTMIYSPAVPVFRDDAGILLEAPYAVSFLTAAAANAGALKEHEDALLEGVMFERTRLVLAVAAARGHSRLILGAWGCGVFRNDPARVSGWFGQHLRGDFSGVFARVVFAIHDRTQERSTLAAFEAVFPATLPSATLPAAPA